MNAIDVQLRKSSYEIYEDYLNFKVDGVWLDAFLDNYYPGRMIKGMISTLVFAMENDAECKVVWDRILPNIGESSNCPVLMCPDDCDFSCTIIIAAVKREADFVYWQKLGIDATKSCRPDDIGAKVEWFENFTGMKFEAQRYLQAIDKFRQQFEKDQLQWRIERLSNRAH